MNATDRIDATTDEASDRPFDAPSFIMNIKLLGICFFNIVLIGIYFCSFTLFVADD